MTDAPKHRASQPVAVWVLGAQPLLRCDPASGRVDDAANERNNP
jgi:hypothetical protein